MHIRDTQDAQEEPINLLPLIDTLFFLLMFFLVGTQFKDEERDIGVQLPVMTSSQPLSAMPEQLIINIREDGTAMVAGKAYDREQLEALLRRAAEANAARDLLIRADERSLHRHFAAVASLCRRAGFSEVKIG